MASPALSAISISSTVDKTDLNLEDTIELSVRINGTQNAPPPQLPPLPSFKVEGMGTTSSFQMINGTVNSFVTHNFRLSPKKAGDFAIGPVTLQMDGRTYVSQEIKIHITNKTTGIPKQGAPVFAEAVVSNKDPYVNEPLILSYRLYRKGEVHNFSMDAPQGDFRRTPLGEPHEYSKILNGIRYHVYETRFILTPMRAGNLQIPPALLSLDLVIRDRRRSHDPFQDFFDNSMFTGNGRLEHKNLHTQSIELKVSPLPEQGKPDNFPNLVGQFTLSGKLNPNKINDGETASYQLILKGGGNLQDAQIAFPGGPYSYRVYPDQPIIRETFINNQPGGDKVFSFAIVPEEPGVQTIPEIGLDFFDPQTKNYQHVQVPEMHLNVLPHPEKTPFEKYAQSRGTTSQDKAGSGLLPIHTGDALFTIQDNPRSQILQTIVVLLFTPLLIGLTLMIRNQRLRLKIDPSYARKKWALSKAEKRLIQLTNESSNDEKRIARDVSQVIREYLGDKLDFQGTALTVEELESILKEKQVETVAILNICNLLEQCEVKQYATVGGSENLDALKQSKELIKELEDLL